MPSDLTADGIRAASFAGARRGYDRGAVDRFVEDVAAHVADLERRLGSLEDRLDQLGISDVPDLASEFDRVGTDIATILGEAERTATDLRRRAAEDAERWRSEAHSEVMALRSEAAADAEQARGDAWHEAAALLHQTQTEAQRLIEAAEQEALYVRAQAEREALTKTAEVQRQAEELMRAARSDAKQLDVEARAESQRLLDNARRSAEAAQERTRALEERRTELLEEIELARHTFVELKRQEDLGDGLALAPGEPAPPTATPGAPEATWDDDDASVKVLPSSSPFARRVDADEMMAEVEMLRSTRDEAAVSESPPDERPADADTPGEAMAGTEPDTVHEAPAPDHQPARQEAAETSGLEPEGEPAPGAVVELEPASVPEREPEPELEPEQKVEPERESELERESEPESDDELGGLFASLRTRDEQDEESASDSDVRDGGASTTEEGPSTRAAGPGGEPESGLPDAGIAGPVVSADAAFELRDRLVLPVQNRVLRDVKRHIVDLQNRVLEQLRVGEGSWSPDPAAFDDDLAPLLADLVTEAYAAGHAAAGEMMGDPAPAVATAPDLSRVGHLAGTLTAELAAADEGVARDAGFRQRSAVVSRVFRSWRTDRAERSVRFIGYSAYHQGLAAGLGALGVPRLEAVTSGIPCAECPATTGRTWAPGDAVPPGSEFPPAHPDCATTLVPAQPVAG